MTAMIKTYRQNRPKEWLEKNPRETWRCDIYPTDGTDHHGIGENEAEAIFNASIAYKKWIVGSK